MGAAQYHIKPINFKSFLRITKDIGKPRVCAAQYQTDAVFSLNKKRQVIGKRIGNDFSVLSFFPHVFDIDKAGITLVLRNRKGNHFIGDFCPGVNRVGENGLKKGTTAAVSLLIGIGPSLPLHLA